MMSLIISSIWELENFYQKKEKKYLHELFERWDLEHFENNEDYRFKDNIGDEGIQNLEDD